MEYATGALGTLLQKLVQLLKEQYNLQKGAKKDIEYLLRELESMSEPLRIVREEPPAPHNQQMRTWANAVRELSYDMEDIVDTFLVRVQGPEPASKRSTKRFIKKMLQKVTEAPARHDIAQEIKDIKERVKEVAERRDRYKVATTLGHQDKDPRTATSLCTLVGIDEAREELILKLTKGDDISSQKQRIVSVVGFGGLGKTTLAREVYEKLKVNFDCTAFVSVSRNPDTNKILKNILYELDRGMYGDIQSQMLDDEQLIQRAQEFLKNKRYFIVIDDIWELVSWNKTIKLALLDNNCGSRVITTTRNVDVAIASGEIYKMLPLSYSNSKKLFFMRIFGDKRKFLDYQSDEISDKFIKKCDGIPLIILTAASLLVRKPREIWYELYRDIGFGHKDNDQVEDTMKILSFSYYDTPSHLKPCLLYLSAFPEDYVIRKDPLIWKWIAEGFVHPKMEIGLFEVGEQYFNNLANRNMIQTVESEVDGIIDGCRVHDMVLDLIRDLALTENFITTRLDNVEGTLEEKKVHRLAFQKSTMEHISPESYHVDLSKVRSYIATMCIFNQKDKFVSFGVLRVLAIAYCQFKEDCNFDNVCNLVHLRYLSVRGTDNLKLPEQIGNLKFLETLDFKESYVEKLPSSIVRLTKLVCLCCGWDITEVPDGIIRNLTSLQQLSITFDWKYDVDHIRRFVKELGSLTELRLLKFSFCNMDEIIERDLVESLRNLHKIQHLEISYFFDTTNADIAKWEAASIVLPGHLRHLFLSRIMFPRLPSCIDLSRLHHLSYLALYVVTLDGQDLKLLSRLTELRFLQLVGMEATVTVNEINHTDGDCFFPNLSWLMLEGAMVHFEQNEESSSFSFHIWNGVDPMPFGSRRYQQGSSSVPFTLMPNLECLRTSVFPLALKDGNSDCSNIGLEYLASLRELRVDILCQRESPADVEEAENMLKSAINAHPNCPTLQVERWQYGTASSVQNQELEDVYNLPMEENGDDQEEVVMQAAEAGTFKLSFP